MRALPAQDAAILRASGVRSERQLAKRAESNPGFVDGLVLPDAAARLRVQEAASAALIRRSLSARVGKYPRLWPTVLFVAMVGVAAAAIWRDVRYTILPNPTIRVARPNGIEPFHIIGRSDLITDPSPPDKAIAAAMESAIGRYSKEYLPQNSVIDTTKLSGGRLLRSELVDRIIVRLKVAPTTLFDKMSPPFAAGLMASPHDRGAGALLLGDVFVLDLQKDSDGTTAVVAISSRDESSFAAFAARSDFYLTVTNR